MAVIQNDDLLAPAYEEAMYLTNVCELAPQDRFRALAAILAVGVTRRRKRVDGQNPAEISPTRLELSPDTVLSVTNPVNGPESPTLGAPA